MTLKKQVEKILKNHPETRNSDITLMIAVWQNFYNIGPSIRTDQLYDLPREDNIKRIRAQFNARGLYRPTDIKIVRARGLNEDKWRELLGYPIKSETVYPTKEESYTNKLFNQKLLYE